MQNLKMGSLGVNENGAGSSKCANNSPLNSSGGPSFPRVSLRSILMSSPFSRRTKQRRVHIPSRSQKQNVTNLDQTKVTNSEKNERNVSSLRRFSGPRSSGGSSLRRSSLSSKGHSAGAKSKSLGWGLNTDIDSASGLSGAVGGIGTTSSLHSSNNSDQMSTNEAGGKMKECPLCLQESSLENFPHLLTCNHLSCLNCLQQYLTVEITESRVNITCPQCHQLLHPTDIHQIINNCVLSYKYEDFMLRRVLSMDPDTRWCPAPDCGYAVIASGCASCPKLKCERPGCESYFCYHCKAEWHPNQTCDMARAQRSPNAPFSSYTYLHDLQNNDDIKSCPRCQVLIVKMNDGSCNHMTCCVCNAEFCWLCMKEISDLHYLSPSGCTFWGKKPWSRKKKIMWQLGTLILAPLGIGLIAGLAVPAMIIGIPIWVGRTLHSHYANSSKHRRNLAMVGGITASALISPVLAALAVSMGVPILLAYVYGVVPISLCRSGGCGVTTSASGVRIAFDDENDMVIGIPGRINEQNQASGTTQSIGEVSCGASLSAESGAHLLAESDRESASTAAIAPASLTGSIASSCLSRTHRLEVQADVSQVARSFGSIESSSLAPSEKYVQHIDMENASTRALAGSLLHYKLTESEMERNSLSGASGRSCGDSASGVIEASVTSSGFHNPQVTNLYIHPATTSLSETSSVLNADATSIHSTTDMRLDSVSAIITARQLHGKAVKGVTFNASMDHISLPLDTDEESGYLDLPDHGHDSGHRYHKDCSSSLSYHPVVSASDSVVLEVENTNVNSSISTFDEHDLIHPAVCFKLENSEKNGHFTNKQLSGIGGSSNLGRSLSDVDRFLSFTDVHAGSSLRRTVSSYDTVETTQCPRSKSHPKLESI